jgi:polar amino acid transport system substrate-binding protein
MKPLRLLARLLARLIASSTCLATLLLCCADAGAAIEIRTAAQINSEPKFIRSLVNGRETVTGMCIDVFHAIEKTDPELKFIGAQQWEPPARIDVNIFDKKTDAACGLIKSKEREGRFTVLKPPLFTFRYTLAVRKDDNVAVSNWKDVVRLGHDSVVLVVHGMGPSRQLEDIPGLQLDAGSSTIQQNFDKLLAHRGRFVYYKAPGFQYLLHEHCMQDKIRILSATMNTLPLYMLLGKHVPPATTERLHLAIRKLKDSGELDRIQSRWENLTADRAPACSSH